MKKAVFVTGAAVGGGRTIAERFAEEGYAVIITSRRDAEGKNTAKEISERYGVFAKHYVLDIRDEQRVIDIFNDIDKNDCFVETIVLNAADSGFGVDPAKGQDFFTVSVEEFQRVLETNIVWNFMMIRQAALRMKEYKKGAIVFIGSNTSYRAIPNRTAYISSKGGINSMSKALAIDLGPFGIRSNVVLSGTIKTDRWVAMGSKQIVNGELTPIGDISDFDDIANAAWFLGSDEAKNITGAEIMLDGGMTSQLYPQLLTKLKKDSLKNYTE